MKTKGTKIRFDGHNIYVGIDYHLKNWKVTIMLNDLEHRTFSQDASSKVLSDYLRKNFPGANYFSAYEAGFSGYSAHRELEELGIKNIVVNPADIPTTDKEKRQKEDRRDSRKIAKSLKNGELNGIYVLTKSMEELRGLVRYRKTIVKEITRNKNRMKSLLYFSGIKIPLALERSSKYWSSRFTEWLADIKLTTDHGNLVIEETIDMVNLLRAKLLKINKYLRQIPKQGEFAKILTFLQSIPGIGLITSLTLLTELEDILRFRKIDQICSFVGLIPSTHSSGEKERIGRITYRSNRYLREALIESAWIARRIDPSLAYSYSQLVQRMEPTEAIVRIAKKLLNRIRYVLKNESEYVQSVI